MYLPWVHVCNRSLILYHESMFITLVFVKSMLPFPVFRYTEIQISELQKYNLQIYKNTNYSKTEIYTPNCRNTLVEMQNCKWRINRNTSDFFTVGKLWIMGTFNVKVDFWIMVDFWIIVNFCKLLNHRGGGQTYKQTNTDTSIPWLHLA